MLAHLAALDVRVNYFFCHVASFKVARERLGVMIKGIGGNKAERSSIKSEIITWRRTLATHFFSVPFWVASSLSFC